MPPVRLALDTRHRNKRQARQVMVTDRHSTRPHGEHPILVGRDREQARLRELLGQAIAGRGHLVLLSGEAGIGKTTLVRDLVQQARERGALVLSGGCYDLTTTPPYGPWSEAIRGYHLDGNQPPVPAWFGYPEELEKVGSQAALFEEARRFFAGIAEHQPLVLVLEDLHWSDAASLDALRYLSRTLNASAVMILVTYRDDEITRRHELYQLLPLLVRESATQRLHLSRLDREAVEKMVAQPYSLELSDMTRLVEHVAERSEGNPFFAEEILQGLEDEQVLRASEGGWLLGTLDQARVPALLRQVIDARLDRLSAETREALQLASVIGQELRVGVWTTASSLNEHELDQVIADALDARLIEETPDGDALQFRHALLREALYESLILNRRRALHRQVGETLIARSHPDPDTIAHHFEQAGDPRAVEWLLKAGVRAEGSYAWRVAAGKYEAAERLLEVDPGSTQARGWLLLQIGHLLRYLDQERGLAHLEAAERLATQIDDPVLSAFSRQFQGLALCFEGQVGAGVEKMEEAVKLLDDSSLAQKERARAAAASLFPEEVFANPRLTSGSLIVRLSMLSSINVVVPLYTMWLEAAGRFHEAINIGERFVSSMSAATDDELLRNDLCRDAYFALANGSDELGQPELARQWRSRALAAYEAVGHYALVAAAHTSALEHLVTYAADRVAERRRTAQAALAAGERAGGFWMVEDRSARQYGVLLDVSEGRWDEASEVAIASLLDRSGNGKEVRSFVFRTLGREREELSPMAWDHIHEVLPDGLSTEPGETYYDLAVAGQRLAAVMLVDAGDLAQARSWLEMHDSWLEWSGAVLGRAEGQMIWARYHQVAGDLEEARQYSESALEQASDPRQPLALLSAHRLLGEIETQRGRYVDAERHLGESLILANACAAPYEQALTKLAFAELWFAAGKQEAVGPLLDQARELCTPLNAQLALGRIADLASRLMARESPPATLPAGLTPREAEVLRLIATAKSNREIAEALFLSPRTVERHIANVYLKIDVHTKAEATAYAKRRHLA